MVGIFGLAWLGDSFIAAHQEAIIAAIGNMTRAAPWTFAIGLFVASMLLYSQAATAPGPDAARHRPSASRRSSSSALFLR